MFCSVGKNIRYDRFYRKQIFFKRTNQHGVTDMSFMFVFYLLASLFYTYVGMATFIYNPKNKANRLFLIICINLALWAMMLTLINAVSDAETATEFRRIATFFWSTVYCLLLHLFLVLVEKDRLC